MTTKIMINNTKRTLEIEKNFSKKASIFGSDEYKMLSEARAAFPTYTVKVKETHRKTPAVQKIDKEFIKKYLDKQSDEKGKEEFDRLCKEASFFEARKWFLDNHPSLKDSKTMTDLILAA